MEMPEHSISPNSNMAYFLGGGFGILHFGDEALGSMWRPNSGCSVFRGGRAVGASG